MFAVNLKDILSRLATALWWGSLTSLGAWVVPTLFTRIPDKTLAGNVAGRLFTLQNYVALGCAWVILLALAYRRPVENEDGEWIKPKMGKWTQYHIGLVALAAIAALLIEYVATPHIMARDNLGFWHPFASCLMLMEWLAVTALLLMSISASKSQT